MRHLHSGRKLKRTSSHRHALLHNMATSLFEHKKISTTLAKAKELRPFAESLITKAKHALINEKQGLLHDGQKIDVHNRRIVGRVIRDKAVLQELFDTIAPKIEDRPGGYTRIIKTGFRRGDAGATAIIELVDFAAPKDGASSFKAKHKKAKTVKPVVKKHVDEEVEVSKVAPKIVENDVIQEPIEVVEESIQDIVTEEPIAEEVEIKDEVTEITPETSSESESKE